MSSKTSKNRRIGNGNAHVCALPRASLDFCSANRAHCSNGGAVMSTAQTLSFRGATRRRNPLKRNVNTVAVAIDRTCFRNFYRAENLCYQFEQGQKLLPQFCKIVCLVLACLARKRINRHLFRAYLYTACAYSEHEPQRRREKRTPSLTYSTSERTSLDSFRPRTSDIKRER